MHRFASIGVERTRERWEAVWTKPQPRGAYDVDQCAIARAYRVPVATIAFCRIPVVVVALSASG